MLNFLEGYQITFNNAIRHLEAAELLSKQKMYGIANSHLILSLEEAVKAGMYIAKHYMPETEIKDLMETGDMAWLTNLTGEKLTFADENWWKQTNANKNHGFYVELNEADQTWQTPESISKKDFLKTRRIVVELLTRFSRLEKAPPRP